MASFLAFLPSTFFGEILFRKGFELTMEGCLDKSIVGSSLYRLRERPSRGRRILRKARGQEIEERGLMRCVASGEMEADEKFRKVGMEQMWKVRGCVMI